MTDWDALTEEERNTVMEAIDVLACLYPLERGRRDRKAWLEWLRKVIEMRAPKVQEVEPDTEKAGPA